MIHWKLHIIPPKMKVTCKPCSASSRLKQRCSGCRSVPISPRQLLHIRVESGAVRLQLVFPEPRVAERQRMTSHTDDDK